MEKRKEKSECKTAKEISDEAIDFNFRMKQMEINICFIIVIISMLTALSVLYSNL